MGQNKGVLMDTISSNDSQRTGTFAPLEKRTSYKHQIEKEEQMLAESNKHTSS